MSVYDKMVCPYCGGYVLLNVSHDVGCCDTCFAEYNQGEWTPPEDEDE